MVIGKTLMLKSWGDVSPLTLYQPQRGDLTKMKKALLITVLATLPFSSPLSWVDDAHHTVQIA